MLIQIALETRVRLILYGSKSFLESQPLENYAESMLPANVFSNRRGRETQMYVLSVSMKRLMTFIIIVLST